MAAIGRVDLPEGNGTPFSLFERTPVRGESCGGVSGIERTNIGDIYFSETNLQALQHGIRYRVFVESNHVIDNQSAQELQTIMRSIYLQRLHNLRDSDTDHEANLAQVRSLNALVLDFAVGRIVTEINMYMKYKRDVTTLPVPLERGQLSTAKGTRILELKMF